MTSSSSSASSSSLSSTSSGAQSIYADLVDPNLVYKFRLVQLSTITATSSVLSGYVNLDPTSGNEWSAITTLFSVFRVVGARWTVVPDVAYTTSSPGSSKPWLCIAADVGQSSVAPANGQAVFDGPNARIISLAPGMNHSDYQISFPNGSLPLMWQAIGGSGQEPFAGGWGQFSYYGQTAGTSDSWQTAVEIYVEVSGRT
jgi:hypothetical protein